MWWIHCGSASVFSPNSYWPTQCALTRVMFHGVWVRRFHVSWPRHRAVNSEPTTTDRRHPTLQAICNLFHKSYKSANSSFVNYTSKFRTQDFIWTGPIYTGLFNGAAPNFNPTYLRGAKYLRKHLILRYHLILSLIYVFIEQGIVNTFTLHMIESKVS